MKKVLFYFVLFFSLHSCGFAYEEHLTGNYYLVAVDLKEDMMVNYHNEPELYLGIGGRGVYEAGWDEHFILTKNYKEIGNSYKYDKSITEYYIIPVNNTQNHFDVQENYLGPLTKEEFKAKRKELDVSGELTLEKL